MTTAMKLRHRAACCRTLAAESGRTDLRRDLLMVARCFEHKARRLQRWQNRRSSAL